MDEERIKELQSNIKSTSSSGKRGKYISLFIILPLVILTLVSVSLFLVKVLDKDSDSAEINQPTESVSENLTVPEQNETNNTSANITSTEEDCRESWNCSDWSNCTNGKKIRTCIDENICNTTELKPETIKDCCSWICEEWSECYPVNLSFRKCSKPENCTEIDDEPETRMNCSYENPCTDTEESANYTVKGTVTDKTGVIWKDTCEDSIVLTEFSCDENGNLITESYNCLVACEDGKCINQTS